MTKIHPQGYVFYSMLIFGRLFGVAQLFEGI